MDKTTAEYAEEILKELAKEDFYDAMKKYGGLKIRCTAKNMKEWWDDIW